MNRFGYIFLSAILLSACTVREGADLQPRRFKVEASLEEETRVSLTQDQSSLGLIARWQEDDAVKVFLSDASSLSDAGTVRIESISDDGHKAIFYYSIPDGFRVGLGTYYLYAFTINSYPMVVDWELQCNGSIIRSPLSSFRAPVMYESDSVGEDSFGYFQHYGVYELLHVYNNSDADISFSLNGFTASAIWYRSTGAIKVPSMEFVVSSAAARAPVDVSAPVTIPAHGSDVIVSWYIPTGHAVTDAQLYASINGEVVKTSNKLYSDIIPQVGHAYHMYAEWDGKELSFISNGKEPLEVETISAEFDVKKQSCTLTGTITNHPELSSRSGFRIWKNENPEDYVDFDSAATEDDIFSLELNYDDLFTIANESPVTGSYKALAFAANNSGTLYYGDVIGFSVSEYIPATGINLSSENLTMVVGTSSRLYATVLPENATERSVEWNSGDNSIVYVDDEGRLTAISGGKTTITATTVDGGFTATCTVIATHPSIGGHECVDLGLSVKWASCNVGANTPEEPGLYFAWGEVAPKETYSWDNYKWYDSNSDYITKYDDSNHAGGGYKTILDPEDDAAAVNWGQGWRMPTIEEWQELFSGDNCKFKIIKLDADYEIAGLRITSKINGNSIFLPAAGYMTDCLRTVNRSGNYWSSSLFLSYWSGIIWSELPNSAYVAYFENDTLMASKTVMAFRQVGSSVRPVRD